MDLYFTDFCVVVNLQKEQQNNYTNRNDESCRAIGFTVHEVLLAKFQIWRHLNTY